MCETKFDPIEKSSRCIWWWSGTRGVPKSVVMSFICPTSRQKGKI